jgi:hypothetical protein
MGLFNNLTSDGLEESKDVLGGGYIIDTDIYTGKIKFAYAGKSSAGAQSITYGFDFNGREYGENFYTKDGKKMPLPGFTLADEICLLTVEKPLSQMTTEEKVLKIYDPEQKKEVPQSVQVLTELTDQEISLAIFKNLENKSEKQGDGSYKATAETRDTNSIEKAFHTGTKMTFPEARAGQEATFWDKWLEKNKGNVRDRREVKDGQAGNAGAPPKAGDAPAPKKSLFGK